MARTDVGQGNAAVLASSKLRWFSCRSLDEVDITGQLGSRGTHFISQLIPRRGSEMVRVGVYGWRRDGGERER